MGGEEEVNKVKDRYILLPNMRTDSSSESPICSSIKLPSNMLHHTILLYFLHFLSLSLFPHCHDHVNNVY